jgi:hypothetical protein
MKTILLKIRNETIRQSSLKTAIAIAACLCALIPGAAVAEQTRFSTVDIVPAPKEAAIDGDLKDWNANAFLETIHSPSLYPNFSMRVGFMHDKKGLYVAAHFVDPTPMVNAADPEANAQDAANGDALRLHLISDPAAPYPHSGEEGNDRICHVTLWRSSPKGEPALTIDYGLNHEKRVVLRGKQSGVVFTADADGKGYTVEALIPWNLLNVPSNAFKSLFGGGGLQTGSAIALSVQPVWGNALGTAPMVSYQDLVVSADSDDRGPKNWGRATFAKETAVQPRPNPDLASGANPADNPLQLKLTLQDPKATTIGLGLFSQEKGLIRSLPVTVRRQSQLGADFELNWDGLDADGKPIPAGAYQLKQLTHQGIGQKFIASLHNAGNPPWKTDDGLGQWGGDWAPPVAATSDANFVYLGWGACEAGPALVCVKKELDSNGLYQKVWGAHPAMHSDVGFGLTALATDGTRLFVAQDGQPYGGAKSGKTDCFAAVTLYDAKTGQALKFPFGKARLPVAQWEGSRCDAEKGKPLFERRKTGDFGPQQLRSNLTGIAVSGDMLYAALFLDNKIVALNWKTGEKTGEFPAEAPSGIAVEADGKLLAATAKGLLRIDPKSGAATPLASGQLSRPWGLALDKSGNPVVADCGTAMQVKIFSPDGRLLRTVGKPEGRAWIGAYDPSGLLMPSGITVDADGKIWVAENDEFPRRVSVWDTSGKNIGDYHGPSVPQTDRGIDPENPGRINVQMVEYELDYETGKYKCLATLWRPHVDGWTPVSNFGRASRLLIRHAQGREYAFLDHGYSDRLGVILIRKGDRFQACASLGTTPGVPVMRWGNEECSHGMVPDPEKWLTPDQWKAVREPGKDAFCHPGQIWHTWADANGDGVVQPEELTLERREWADQRSCSFTGVEDDLTLWGLGRSDIYRLPVKEFTAAGVPIYPARTELKPLFTKVSGADASIWMDAKRQRVYGFDAKGGDSRMRGEWAGVSCYDFSGKLLWLYRDTWLGFASDSPFFKPGRIIGVNKIIGQADLDNGVGLLVMPGYYGDYSMISTDGLWVHEFCQDNRLGGGAGPDTVFIENMTGIFYRNAKNGKVYLIGGDIDARVWEVTGLETIRTAETPLMITEQDFAAASAIAGRTKTASSIAPIILGKAGRIEVDGKTAEWAFDRALAIDAGAGRGAKVSLACDDTTLYAAFKVDDRSPMANTSTDPAMIFKGGDLCDVMLASDPSADSKRTKPVAGDTRLSFGVINDKPVCVIYQAKTTGPKAPMTFTSPTGEEVFERVQVLDSAKVSVTRTATGYELEAAVPLAEIGFKPAPGQATRGDVGVLFGTDGGGRTILRAYYSNKDTMVVEDVPSEARLTPANWTTLEVKP